MRPNRCAASIGARANDDGKQDDGGKSMTDKPFALFLGDDYYPDGGWRDFVGFFETIDEAIAAAVEPEEDCVSGWGFHVADLRTGKIVTDIGDAL